MTFTPCRGFRIIIAYHSTDNTIKSQLIGFMLLRNMDAIMLIVSWKHAVPCEETPPLPLPSAARLTAGVLPHTATRRLKTPSPCTSFGSPSALRV